MKRLLLSLLLVVGIAQAQEITVIGSTSKSSPTGVLAMGIKDALGAGFYQASNCEDAIAKYNKTPNSVFVYDSAYEFGAWNTGTSCPLKGNATASNTVFIGETYMYICRRPGTNYEFGANSTTLGMASMYATRAHQETFKQAGANVKIVPYAGSKDVLNALRAGDIDLGWIGSGLAQQQVDQGNLDCLYSTNPRAANFLGRALPKLAIPNYHIDYVVYTNTTDPKVRARIWNIKNNEQFNAYMKTSLTTGTFEPTQKNFDYVLAFVERMKKYWGDRR